MEKLQFGLRRGSRCLAESGQAQGEWTSKAVESGAHVSREGPCPILVGSLPASLGPWCSPTLAK